MCNSLKTLINQTFSGASSGTSSSHFSVAPLLFNKTVLRKYPAKLWELPTHYHCMVVGTCLSVEELQKLVRQSGIEIQDHSDYGLHSLFVNHASEPNRLSRLMQKHLEKKYASYRKRFAVVTNNDHLFQLWNEAKQQGEIAGALWVAMTHPIVDEFTQHEIYAQVHMLSHQVGALQRAELRKLHALQQREIESQKQLNELRQSVQERDKQLQTVQQELQIARQLIRTQAETTVQVVVEEELQQTRQQAQQEISKLREQLTAMRTQSVAQRAQLETLHTHLQQEQDERRALEEHLERLLTPASCSGCEISGTEQCPLPNQPSRCVLYVGGRDKLKPHFRTLVEQQYGGRFLHHDGGLHGKDQYLYQVLCQADIVFCPIDCISHNACHTIKQFCKKHNKPVVLLRTESLSAFTHGLREGLGQVGLTEA